MASINTKPKAPRTHEGAVAAHINPEQELRRSVMACLLWENQFYEEGVDIAIRIESLCNVVKPDAVKSMAVEAREQMKLRHIPLLLTTALARRKSLDAETLARIIQRADELPEYLAVYWKDGKHPLAAQVKKGLALAFQKFNAYELGKYNRDNKIKLRDVLFLCHAKPKDDEQGKVWKKLIDGDLESPPTWEVILSAAKSKGQSPKEAWEQVIDLWITEDDNADCPPNK